MERTQKTIWPSGETEGSAFAREVGLCLVVSIGCVATLTIGAAHGLWHKRHAQWLADEDRLASKMKAEGASKSDIGNALAALREEAKGALEEAERLDAEADD